MTDKSSKRKADPNWPQGIRDLFNELSSEREDLEKNLAEIILNEDTAIGRGKLDEADDLMIEKNQVTQRINRLSMIEACLCRDWDDVKRHAKFVGQETLDAVLSTSAVYAPRDVIECLLDNGADPRNAKDNPMARARKAGREEIVELLTSHIAKLEKMEWERVEELKSGKQAATDKEPEAQPRKLPNHGRKVF